MITHENIKNFEQKLRSGEIARSEQYDAYFDVKTREWLESACGDSYCNFCSQRPEKAP